MGLTRSFSKIPNVITVDLGNSRIGIGSTQPTETLDITGITTIGTGSTYFFNTGSTVGNAESVSSLTSTSSFNVSFDISAVKFSGIGSDIVGVGITSYAVLQERENSGTSAGTASASSWNVREINYIREDGAINGGGGMNVTVSAPKFTLQPGTYMIQWDCSHYMVKSNVMRLYNVTDGEMVGYGATNQTCMHGFSYYSTNAGMESVLNKTSKFTIDAAKEFRIEMANAQTLNIGMGRNTSAPFMEYYTQVYIYKF